MKKYWSIVTSIVLVALIGMNFFTVKISAANTTFTNQKCGENTYATLDANGVLTISGTGKTWDNIIEGDLYTANYGVAPWEECKEAIKKVVFTEKVTDVGASAFSNCVNLKEVTFNEYMQGIGNFAFKDCSSLDVVNWSTGLTSIGQQAFSYAAFVEVSIPDGVSFIDACAFEYCNNLNKVYIGSCSSSPFIIGNSVFRGCNKLEEITVSKDHFALMSIDGVLYNAERKEGGEKYPSMLQEYPRNKKNKEYIVPETVTRINNMSIEGNPYLETVTLHNNIVAMSLVFNGMDSLKNLTIPSSVVEVMEVGGNCNNLQWLKNESNCDIPLLPYRDWKWYDENGNEISVIKAKSTAYCKLVIEEPEGDSSAGLPDEPPVDTLGETPTTDNVIDEAPSSGNGNNLPSSGGNSTPPSTDNPPVKEDSPSSEPIVEPEEPTTEDASDETEKEPQTKPVDDVIESDKIVEVYKEQVEENVKDIELMIDKPTVVDKTLFESISQMDKNIVIAVVDANNKIQYSWTFSKNAIKNTDVSVDLNISFEVDKKTEIEEKIGNKNSKYMEFSHSGELAGAATINMYVGDTYSDGEKLYLYYYDEEAKEVLMVGDKAIEVKDGYVAYTITHCSIYFMDTEKFDVALDSASLKDANISVKDLVINNGQYEVVAEDLEKEEETTENPTTASKEEVTEEDKLNEETTTSSIDNDGKEEGKSPMWIILIIGVLVVGGAAAAVVIINKKKKEQ